MLLPQITLVKYNPEKATRLAFEYAIGQDFFLVTWIASTSTLNSIITHLFAAWVAL